MFLFRIKNTGLRYLLIFTVISFINDFWSITFGLPTLFQLLVLFILLFLPKKKLPNDLYITVIDALLKLYLVVILINSIFTYQNFGVELGFISVILKWVAFIVITPYLIYTDRKDFIYFLRLILLALIGLVLVPGLLEFYLGRNIMEYSYGITERVFYLRAFSIDKVDFGFNLVLLIACAVTLLRFRGKKRLFLIGLSLLAAFLLVYSFSATNILGLVLSAFFYLLLSSKRKILTVITFLVFGAIVYIYTEDYRSFYVDKIERQSTQGVGKEEFRSRAFIESVDVWLEKPIVGHGTSANGYLMKQRIEWLYKTMNSHNFINEFTDYGFIGGGILFFFLSLIFIQTVRKGKRTDPAFVFWVIITGPIIVRYLFYYHRFDKFSYVLWVSSSLLVLFMNRNTGEDQKKAAITHNLKHKFKD